MGRDWAEWWSKGGCVGRKSNRGFFGRISGASSCLSAGPLFPVAGITTIAARQGKRTPREVGDRLAEGLCCRVSLGAPDTSVPPWEGAGRGLPDRLQRWDTSLWAAFSAPTREAQ